MNEAIRNIMTRRSVRDYKAEQIKDEELNSILEAGLYAPSAMNQQSWHIIAIQNKVLFDKLAKKIEEETGENQFFNATGAILVFGDKNSIDPLKDGSLAMENMMLAAHAIGVGTCWINSVVRLFSAGRLESFQEELDVPTGYECVACCVFGYPNETPQPKPRKQGNVHIIK